MSKIDKLSLADIIESINVYFDTTNSGRIWKKEVPALIISQGKEELDELEDIEGLNVFVHKYGLYIDNVKFLVASIDSYNKRLAENTSEIERERLKVGLNNAKKLLSDVNETYVFLDENEKTNLITSVTVFNTQELSKEISRKHRNDNAQRLVELESETDFGNITQSILRSDVQFVITTNKDVGQALRYKIEYNSLARQLQNTTDRKRLRNVDIGALAQKQKHSIFVNEINKTLKDNIEEFDFDKLLLTSARNYLDMAELRRMEDDETELLRETLEIIKRHIKRANTKVPSIDDESKQYTARELERDLKRFIVQGSKTRYLSKEDCKKIKLALLEGRTSINALTVDIVEALDLKPVEISKLISVNVNNYIFFLRQGKVIDSKEIILKNIINANQCSGDLLQLLCEKANITSEDVCDLFDRGIISVTLLRSVREQLGSIITNQKLFGKYQEYKQSEKSSEEAENARVQLERYALAYRTTECIGKTDEELEEKGEEFITEVGEDIQTTDLIPLYGYGIIPLKVAVDWGGDRIIEQLLSSETLKPSDARHLRNKGLLNENVLERLFKNNVGMSYSYQVALVCTVFDGQTQKEQEIRQKLAQYYNIENGIVNTSRKTSGSKKKNSRGEESEEVNRKIKMRDPGAKYNLLSGLDKDVKIEQGIIDGHIIFHYPNIEEGTVVIEKLHKITINKETGAIEIKADNKAATYVMSEEEFIEMKSQLIQEGRIDRSQLTQKWWETRDPKHWIPHLGTKGWEESLKERFGINSQNSRYSQDDLQRIEQLIEKSIESKKGEDR